MDDSKFQKRLIEVVGWLLRFRAITDKSDKRIARDTIRAIVKELTRV